MRILSPLVLFWNLRSEYVADAMTPPPHLCIRSDGGLVADAASGDAWGASFPSRCSSGRVGILLLQDAGVPFRSKEVFSDGFLWDIQRNGCCLDIGLCSRDQGQATCLGICFRKDGLSPLTTVALLRLMWLLIWEEGGNFLKVLEACRILIRQNAVISSGCRVA